MICGHSLWAIMGISLKTHKILWGRSGNKCAICKNELIVDSENSCDPPSIVGDEAHIIAKKENFARGDYDSLTEEQRNDYSNLILLCKIHHKQIDDQPLFYTVERLHEIKNIHEKEVNVKLSLSDKKQQQDDIVYSSFIDEWERFADLDNWQNTCACLSADTPSIPKVWYEKQKEFLIWIIGRIWPHRYMSLENALINYSAVLQDFMNIFNRHIENDSINTAFLRTEKFYRIDEFDKDKYHQLRKLYIRHDCLVNDLFFELTRSANYICDKVRETLFSGYRVKEGALLIERHNVGYELKTLYIRVEYRAGERTERPYPGLETFKEIRYTSRDYAVGSGRTGDCT